MRRVDLAAALTFAVDGMTAAASAFNGLALLALRAREHSLRRRYAMAVLAMVSAGVAVQAVFAQALYTAHRFEFDVAPFFGTGPWLASRVVLLAGTMLLSSLILRRASR
jgi:hypothetical protein